MEIIEKLKKIMGSAYQLDMVEFEDENEEVNELESFVNIGNCECSIPVELVKEIYIQAQEEAYEEVEDLFANDFFNRGDIEKRVLDLKYRLR